MYREIVSPQERLTDYQELVAMFDSVGVIYITGVAKKAFHIGTQLVPELGQIIQIPALSANDKCAAYYFNPYGKLLFTDFR